MNSAMGMWFLLLDHRMWSEGSEPILDWINQELKDESGTIVIPGTDWYWKEKVTEICKNTAEK